jgi:flagellar M-ring protein FliF
MDFLNKSLAQVGELFRSMTPGARLTAGLLLAVVVVSMGYLFRQGVSGPDVFLFGGAALSDGQLTRVEAAIAQAGLSDARREGNRIRVPAGQQAKYLAAVADGGALPSNFNTILEDAVGKDSPWSSREQTRQRMKIAKEQTLSEIVRAMYWVESASVLYDEHESHGLRRVGGDKEVSASVSVKPAVGETLSPSRAKNIQKLVAHAVNMEANDVAVINLGEGGAAGSDSEMSPDMFPDGSMMQTKVAFETQKRESIRQALRDIPGVRVQVNADFDTTVEEVTRNVQPPEAKPAVQRETTKEETSIRSTGDGGGRPGLTAQGPNRQGPTQVTPESKNETKSKVSETDNLVGVDEKQTRKTGYTLKEVWATVMVPNGYLESLWKIRNPTANAPAKTSDLALIEAEVRPKIENLVDPLLLLKEIRESGENTYKHVKLVFLDLPPAPTIEPPSMASTATSWVGRYWSTLGMLGVAMFSLMVLRGVVNGKPTDSGTPAAGGAPALKLHGDESQAAAGKPIAGGGASGAPEEAAPERPKLRLKKGTSLKDDLADIVREDPDAAADILRSWIGKTG